MLQPELMNLNLSDTRLSHAYIAEGGNADLIAGAAICSGNGEPKPCMICNQCKKYMRGIHPDVIFVNRLPKKREILVDQIRELKRDVIVLPNEAEKKVYIINDADTMNTSAQNAFLQMLEEPPSHTVFILKTGNPSTLLPTIRSRCVKLGGTSSIGVSEDQSIDDETRELASAFFIALDVGNTELVKLMFRIDKLSGRGFAEFLSAARQLLVEKMRTSQQRSLVTEKMERFAIIQQTLDKCDEMMALNVSAGYLSGLICAKLLD